MVRIQLPLRRINELGSRATNQREGLAAPRTFEGSELKPGKWQPGKSEGPKSSEPTTEPTTTVIKEKGFPKLPF